MTDEGWKLHDVHVGVTGYLARVVIHPTNEECEL